MLIVTVDQYSGLPNPSWQLDEASARDVLRNITLNKDVVAGEISGYQGLGYRGMVVELADDSLSSRYELPTRFRIANGGSLNEAKGLEIAQQVVDSMPVGTTSLGSNTELTDHIRRQIQEHLVAHPRFEAVETSAAVGAGSLPQPVPEGESITPEHLTTLSAAAACPYWATAFNPNFWNSDPYVRWNNNCYNYAVNRRTNTFAQPGKASGYTPAMSCAGVGQGARLDGANWWGVCFPAGTQGIWIMALVVAPNYDYHWYRYSAEGFWGHKPGHTSAKNTDNNGNIVYSPYYAARAPYTDFCGYFQCAYTMRIS